MVFQSGLKLYRSMESAISWLFNDVLHIADTFSSILVLFDLTAMFWICGLWDRVSLSMAMT